MFLIERIAKTPATLQRQSPYIHDGKQSWTSEPVKVFERRNMRLPADSEDGQTQYGHAFLVPPLAVDPVLPLRIIKGDKTFDVTYVKYYQNHRGKNLGYLMTVAGA